MTAVNTGPNGNRTIRDNPQFTKQIGFSEQPQSVLVATKNGSLYTPIYRSGIAAVLDENHTTLASL